jgi:hypothetical protein
VLPRSARTYIDRGVVLLLPWLTISCRGPSGLGAEQSKEKIEVRHLQPQRDSGLMGELHEPRNAISSRQYSREYRSVLNP